MTDNDLGKEFVADVINELIEHVGDVRNMAVEAGKGLACRYCLHPVTNHGDISNHNAGCLFAKTLAIRGLK